MLSSRGVLGLLALSLALLAACGSLTGRRSSPAASRGDAPMEIRNALEQWSRDFNAGNAPAVCGLFARDVRVMYPGRTDRDYDAVCRELTEAMRGGDRTFRYDAPQVADVVVSGDMAVVRLVWTLRASGAGGNFTARENGVDIFRRQSDGAWRISLSHSYPDVQPEAAGGAGEQRR